MCFNKGTLFSRLGITLRPNFLNSWHRAFFHSPVEESDLSQKGNLQKFSMTKGGAFSMVDSSKILGNDFSKSRTWTVKYWIYEASIESLKCFFLLESWISVGEFRPQAHAILNKCRWIYGLRPTPSWISVGDQAQPSWISVGEVTASGPRHLE